MKGIRIKAVVLQVAFFSALWWVFSDGSAYQLWFGAVVVAIATAVSAAMGQTERRPTFLRAWALLQFIPYFVQQSFRGGLIVASLALVPQRQVQSQYVPYPVSLPREAPTARMFFACCLSLFPGSLACGYRGDELTIHFLDKKSFDLEGVRHLEQFTAAIFGMQLPPSPAWRAGG